MAGNLVMAETLRGGTMTAYELELAKARSDIAMLQAVCAATAAIRKSRCGWPIGNSIRRRSRE